MALGGFLSSAFELSLRDIVKSFCTPSTLGKRIGGSDFEQLITWLISSTSVEQVKSLRQELLEDDDFYSSLNERYLPVRYRRLGGGPFEGGSQREALYVIVRLLKPDNFVETGVFDGLSSSYILRAMGRNGKGHLSSIDLPALQVVQHSTSTKMGVIPKGRQPGWVIPDQLRQRHTLMLGDSKDLLAARLKELQRIDVFFHDSLHTYEHMNWEFETAWPSLRRDGLLLSDDVFGWAARGAFFKFCRRKKIECRLFGKLGAARKTS